MSKVAHLKCCSSSCTLMGSCTLIWMVNAAVCTARRRLSSPLDLPAPAAGPACVRCHQHTSNNQKGQRSRDEDADQDTCCQLPMNSHAPGKSCLPMPWPGQL